MQDGGLSGAVRAKEKGDRLDRNLNPVADPLEVLDNDLCDWYGLEVGRGFKNTELRLDSRRNAVQPVGGRVWLEDVRIVVS